MKEINIGTLGNRQLCVLFYNAYNERSFWVKRFNDGSHRCYCPSGKIIDGRICFMGIGITFFYSHYWGDVPCVCDKIVEEFMSEVNDEKTKK